MSGEQQLSGPDLTHGISLSDLEDGGKLLGHAGGEAVLVVRQGEECFAIGAARAGALTNLSPAPVPDPEEFVDTARTIRGQLSFTGTDQSQLSLEMTVALPDGVIVATGG